MTYDEACEQYDDNCDWDDGAGDVAKARLFKQACRILLRKTPTLAMHTAMGGPHQVMHDVKVVQAELNRVVSWLNGNDPAIAAASPRSSQLVLDEFRS